MFKVALTAPSTPAATGTAVLTPTFTDNATAANGKTGAGNVKLALGDLDSGAIVPASSPRYGGSYVITDQTALQLVFAKDIFNGTGLTALKTLFGLDDIKWATSDGGTLYIVDRGSGMVAHATLYKVTGPFKTGTAVASNDSVSDQVVKVNLTTGGLTPFVRGLDAAKGLVYLDPSGSEAQLPLNGGTAAPVSAPTKVTGAAAPKSKSGGSSNTGTVVIIVIIALLLLGGAGFAIRRRGTTAGP